LVVQKKLKRENGIPKNLRISLKEGPQAPFELTHQFQQLAQTSTNKRSYSSHNLWNGILRPS